MCLGGVVVLILSMLLPEVSTLDTASAHLGIANKAFAEERFGEAANGYQKALELDPKLLTARRDLAVCRFELRQYDLAEVLLAELLKYNSTGLMAHYYLGRIDVMEAKFRPAIKHFLLITTVQPFRDEKYFLGMAYYKMSDWETAAKTLRDAIQDNPRDFRSHQLLARTLQKLGREDPAAREFSQTRELLSYYAEGSQALKQCSQLLSNDASDEIDRACGTLLETDDVDKLAAVGMMFGKAGFFDRAEEAWRRAAVLDPESPEIRYDLALTCFHLKHFACARENANAAIKARSDFPEANVLYASVLYKLGADEEALPALRRAYALSPRDAAIHEMLANELMLWADHYAKTKQFGEAGKLRVELDALQPVHSEQDPQMKDRSNQKDVKWFQRTL